MKYFILFVILLSPSVSYGDSKRIEVYSVSQAYWDVKTGETLGEIIKELLPHNSDNYSDLINEIVHLNPHAFVNGDPDMMKANVRLWLPGHINGLNKKINKDKYTIKKFSWGYIKQAK